MIVKPPRLPKHVPPKTKTFAEAYADRSIRRGNEDESWSCKYCGRLNKTARITCIGCGGDK